MDSLCDSMNNVKINEYINLKLIRDLDILINELARQETFNVDIYEICVSCGHDLTWDQDYLIYNSDIEWLKNGGQVYFFTTLHSKKPINTPEDYRCVQNVYKQLFDLFCLQVTSN